MSSAMANKDIVNSEEFDAIVVGTGPGGATFGRELARNGKRVLLLEQGGHRPPRDGMLYMASVSRFAPVADGVAAARAATSGGTSAMYFGVAEAPPLETFRSFGIDLADALEQAKRALPLVEPVPDSLLGAQTLRVRDSAVDLGIRWVKTKSMFLDAAKLGDRRLHAAVWRAKSYVDEAVQHGATLVSHADVRRVLTADGRAIGVEYELGKGRRRERRQAFARRVVIAAGAFGTPRILRDSGVAGVGEDGFYCDPALFVFGTVDGLDGGDILPGYMSRDVDEDGIRLGDGCLSRTLYRLQMLASREYGNVFRYRKHIGVGVMVRDALGGRVHDNGRLEKDFTHADRQKLEKGAALAERIVRNAGAKRIVRTPLSAAHVGGLLQLDKHLDADLQTRIANLHVCDHSLMPQTVQVTPVLTLVCLGKYLADRLLARL
jgi:hypothetical protein